jgi:Tol biopolymer transport system component
VWKLLKQATCAAALTASVLTGSETIGAAQQTEPAVRAESPQRVSQAAVPATIAFTNDGHLWILDASRADAMPRQVTAQGKAEIAGWSADGEWLLYLQYDRADEYSSPAYLWAVKADGTGAFQVDERSILDQPKWSPVSRTFAYRANAARTGEEQKPVLVVARLAGEKPVVVGSQTTEIADFAWMPDGRRLLISVPAASGRPMTLQLTDLVGRRLAAYPLAEPPKVEEGIYPWAADGLTVAPDGKRVAYYVRVSSASLSADGVAIQLFDLSQPARKPVDIGSGLAYPEWLNWSPDSSKLAFIDGGDRMATHNKRVTLADVNGRVIPAGQPGMVDTLPKWTAAVPYALYFTRGVAKEYQYEPQTPMVPGQRIWRRSADGRQQAVTQGTEKTADSFPAPSPDGNELLFVRLDSAEHGSLYLKTGDSGGEVELLRHVTGDIGYYANYLPPWVRVFWKEEKPH